jgi:hypothetical protein
VRCRSRREVVAGGEPGDVGDLDQQPGGNGGADAVQVHQRGAGGGDQRFEFGGGGLALVDPLEVADQLAATRRRALPAASRGRPVASKVLAWAADSAILAPPGMSSNSSWCSWEIIRVWSSPRDLRLVPTICCPDLGTRRT